LAFSCILEAQRSSTLGRARISEVVHRVGHFRESLADFESLRWLSIQFKHNGALQDVNKSWRRMKVPARRRTGCYVSHPNMHLAVFDLIQIYFEKVSSLDGLLLGTGDLTAGYA
jgi:hypothetical protein